MTTAGRFPRLRHLLLILGLAVGIGAAVPVFYLVRTGIHDVDERRDPPTGHVDDASRLNRTRVAEVWQVPVDHANPEEQIRGLLERARVENRKVAIAGARHSMGGHTIYPGGVALQMLSLDSMQFDANREILTVQAGATWKEVIAYLEPLGRSVAVMQSNNSFSVGGSVSVNCHGWQYARPPIASTVESFRLMRPDGSVVRCSRNENRELFSLALGGYGLFGIILDVDLRVVPNRRYRLEQYLVPVDRSLATFDQRIRDEPGAEMVYARMGIVPDRLFEEVLINAFVRDPGGEIPALEKPGIDRLRRAVFRGSQASDFGKRLRWSAETRLQPLIAGRIVSRNQLLNEGVEAFANRTAETTDVLHEYFVPRETAAGFVEAARRLVRRHEADLLNVTVRSVNEDGDTFLRYADQPMLAFVMLFVQERSDSGERRMQALTRDLIEAALEKGGRYYLPYRLHATPEQFHRAYPQAREFFELKRRYDPEELFQNRFYLEYGRPGA